MDRLGNRGRRGGRRKPTRHAYDLASTITPPFKKCIMPDCYFTYITEDTLSVHLDRRHKLEMEEIMPGCTTITN